MGRTAGTAMQYENIISRKSHTARVQRISRTWVAKSQYKAIDRLSGLQISLYLVKRYQTQLIVLLAVVGWSLVFTGWLG